MALAGDELRSRSGDYTRQEGRAFPSYEEAWNGRLETDQMQWMHPRAVCDDGLIRQYVSGGAFRVGRH